MNTRILLTALMLCLVLISCHHSIKEVVAENDESQRFGAVYIGCDSPPWIFTHQGLLSCEQEQIAAMELNPDHACAFQSIVDEEGSLSVNFSIDFQLGRIHVIKLKNDIDLSNQAGDSINEIYVDETDHFFVEQGGIKLKVSVKNAYVGGCFHELIQWEEVE